MNYRQKLPEEVGKELDQYIKRIKKVKWFKQSPSLEKSTNGNFLQLVDLWEMGLYPIGVVDGKFICYIPKEFKKGKK